MKNVGYLLITAGFILGAFKAAQSVENEVAWGGYFLGFGLSVLGVVLARRAGRVAAGSGGGSHQIQALTTALDRVVRNIGELDAEKESLFVYDVHGRIDERFPRDLATFVDARMQIAHAFGLQGYAAVMNEFASGERYLNRAWSASVDGYVDEVHASISRSRSQFEVARERLRELSKR